MVEHWPREKVMWVRIPPGVAHFFFEKERESEPSQVFLLCCLALFIVSQLFNHVLLSFPLLLPSPFPLPLPSPFPLPLPSPSPFPFPPPPFPPTFPLPLPPFSPFPPLFIFLSLSPSPSLSLSSPSPLHPSFHR